MKTIFMLAAFALLGGTIVSCDNMPEDSAQQDYFATDDGNIPINPPPPPPQVPTKPPK